MPVKSEFKFVAPAVFNHYESTENSSLTSPSSILSINSGDFGGDDTGIEDAEEFLLEQPSTKKYKPDLLQRQPILMPQYSQYQLQQQQQQQQLPQQILTQAHQIQQSQLQQSPQSQLQQSSAPQELGLFPGDVTTSFDLIFNDVMDDTSLINV
ncbi:uncharacterized protein SPAPADRAFT_60052 [Spathaspora passalidarum NRRL Y-27907]|uniref:Uncharacterized protein n=1 Tax=Spathaspora passalidarum (strain NRRL Y-27907 / 11-Y1) TaxID=619300 RepID=G3ALT6_SPAPN|nr:uncharacterized protein SPAPADRAFT_60052 [Spathaspora passalidarum NRRL Y-27907]EGW32694.1 hypothetical protein SPAPADRAFT_60052 [Spathaspora passalidarum NRRL Y-27907]